jgi:hypothetical protein
MKHRNICKRRSLRFIGLYLCLALLQTCAMPATFTGMVPASFEIAKKHPQSVRIRVTGGQEDEASGRPHIPNDAFTQALIHSILRSQIFARVVDSQSKGEDYLLTVTLFSMDMRIFGHTVSLEAGWTLQRGGTGTIAWQESIVSEFNDANVRLATEGAARNNIVQGLAKMSRLNL